ncbi:histone-like nucleoid-structuring protein, MvaT/MvaU family [Oceanospirillum sanctuarii]|uniref:histone-like nucleoid-structuring protein, MvaT/MvaU family n=1 Tax=Oceanospirillum sanctuarii TaxID=1434821 RepID=UPI000A3670B1|nr:histone-like nucleoid-structuring protein, MvaT/MvaU family [Oceanospirillum sanctuarii]
MSIINKYREKERLMRQLQEELQAMEEKQELKQELAFKTAIEDVLKQFDKSESDLIALFAGDEDVAEAGKSRRKRTPSVYKNPQTGEEITVRGGRQKDYQEWIQQYGKETVQGWKVS